MYRPYCAVNNTDTLFKTASKSTGPGPDPGLQGSMAYTVHGGCKLSPFVSECYEDYGCRSECYSKIQPISQSISQSHPESGPEPESIFLDFHVEYGSASALFHIVGVDIDRDTSNTNNTNYTNNTNNTNNTNYTNYTNSGIGGSESMRGMQQHVDLSL